LFAHTQVNRIKTVTEVTSACGLVRIARPVSLHGYGVRCRWYALLVRRRLVLGRGLVGYVGAVA
jgi:hypothetical protein